MAMESSALSGPNNKANDVEFKHTIRLLKAKYTKFEGKELQNDMGTEGGHDMVE